LRKEAEAAETAGATEKTPAAVDRAPERECVREGG
jgi:hypothetical protein